MISQNPRMLVILLEPIGSHGSMLHFDLAFCQALAKHDLDLVWATCDETKAAVSGFELWTPFHNIYGSAPAWRRGLNHTRGLWAILSRACCEARHRPVVIHQQFITLLPLEWCLAFLARLHGIPCVLTPHDTVPFGMKELISSILPGFYRQYDIVIAHAKNSLAELQRIRRDASRVRYIALGNFNDAYSSGHALPQSEARSQLGLPDTAAVILFLGQIKVEKGLEYLIKAMPDVLKDVPNALLLVAGRPWHNDVEPYEQLIDQLGLRRSVHVRWGYVPNEELSLYYRAADVIALPYTHVYQSGVVMTAYAFRRPVVASAVGGLKEQVQDGRTGYLVPPRESRALARALVNVLSDPVLASTMGQTGHAWAADVGNWDKIAAQTVQVYNEVWQRRHAI